MGILQWNVQQRGETPGVHPSGCPYSRARRTVKETGLCVMQRGHHRGRTFPELCGRVGSTGGVRRFCPHLSPHCQAGRPCRRNPVPPAEKQHSHRWISGHSLRPVSMNSVPERTAGGRNRQRTEFLLSAGHKTFFCVCGGWNRSKQNTAGRRTGKER